MKRFDRMVRRGCTSAAVILVAVLAWPTAGWSQSALCEPVTGVAGLVCNQIAAWGQALDDSSQRIHHYPVLDKYASDAILLPMCSGAAAIGRADMRRYFVERILPAEPRLTRIGMPIAGQRGDVIFGSGWYELTLNGNASTKDAIVLPAAYTFVFRRTGNAYLIVQQGRLDVCNATRPWNP